MVPSQRYCTKYGAANQAQDAFCFACGYPLQATPASPQYPLAGSATSSSTGLLTPNLLLKQRYRILSQVGKGGFGAVYKAEDVQLGNRLLAVKEMSQSGLSPQEIAEATENFKREALLLAALKHPSLPSIYEQFSEAGRWYLVMDFIEGETLEAYLAQAKGGKLSIEETLRHRLIPSDLDEKTILSMRARGWITLVLFVLSIGLAFLSPLLARISWFAIFLIRPLLLSLLLKEYETVSHFLQGLASAQADAEKKPPTEHKQ